VPVRNLVPMRLVRGVLALLIVLAITLFYRKVMHVNATTVALSLLLAILVTSTVWGMAVSAFMSVAAMLAFNYFFLPPIGTFTIADPQNWVALFAFLVTAVVASRLSTQARQKAADANRRQREVERLYAFSQGLLGFGNVIGLLNSIPRQVVDSFEVGAAALFLVDKQKVYRSGPELPALSDDRLKAMNAREEPVVDAASGLCFAPVRLGVRATGSLGIFGPVLSRQTLEALGTLIAIAVERARAVEQLGKNEAAREGERLKSALLDAITHDFRTPLTSIKASVTSLLSDGNLRDEQRHELLTIIDEESNRLNHLVGEAAEMAQLEAGEIELQARPYEVSEVISGAIEHCKALLGARPVEVRVAEKLPAVRVDLPRAQEALERLLENAHMYSRPGEPICISAELSGEAVSISVADRGPGIDDQEQSLIFDKFYRGKDQRYLVQGTGMGLPIAKAIVEAHGGTIALVSQAGHGSVFSLSFPMAGGREGR
jgi:two-component system, OmpR family, sensor histidine kinase KdpD